MNPNFGGPSIDEINSITGYNSDWGADAGEEKTNSYEGGAGSNNYAYVNANEADLGGVYAQNFIARLQSSMKFFGKDYIHDEENFPTYDHCH